MIEYIDYRNDAVEGDYFKTSLFNFQQMLYNLRETTTFAGKIVVPNWNKPDYIKRLADYFSPEFFYDMGGGVYSIDMQVKKVDRIRKNRIPPYTLRRYGELIKKNLEKELGLRDESSFYLLVGKEVEFYVFLQTKIGYKFVYNHQLVHLKTEIFDAETGVYIPEKSKRNPFFIVNEKLRTHRGYIRRKNNVKRR